MPLHRPTPALRPALAAFATVTALLLVLVEFGVPITEGQQTAIQTLVAALAPIVAGIIIRLTVYSPASAQKIANDAAVTGNAADTAPPPPSKSADVPREQWGINRYKKQDGPTV